MSEPRRISAKSVATITRISRVIVYVGARDSLTTFHTAQRLECGNLPPPAEAGKAGLAGEELLHDRLLEVALLGDESI